MRVGDLPSLCLVFKGLPGHHGQAGKAFPIPWIQPSDLDCVQGHLPASHLENARQGGQYRATCVTRVVCISFEL